MPSYNMTPTQMAILTSWLFEPQGYLDSAMDGGGTTAREALAASPGLDVTQWVRDTGINIPTADDALNGCAMVWWIRAHDQVNITPPTRPPESVGWVAILHKWDDSINAGFARVPQGQRATQQTLYAEDGSTTTLASGAHLAQQQQVITQVLGVLE